MKDWGQVLQARLATAIVIFRKLLQAPQRYHFAIFLLVNRTTWSYEQCTRTIRQQRRRYLSPSWFVAPLRPERIDRMLFCCLVADKLSSFLNPRHGPVARLPAIDVLIFHIKQIRALANDPRLGSAPRVPFPMELIDEDEANEPLVSAVCAASSVFPTALSQIIAGYAACPSPEADLPFLWKGAMGMGNWVEACTMEELAVRDYIQEFQIQYDHDDNFERGCGALWTVRKPCICTLPSGRERALWPDRVYGHCVHLLRPEACPRGSPLSILRVSLPSASASAPRSVLFHSRSRGSSVQYTRRPQEYQYNI